jgi:hypothetical protein
METWNDQNVIAMEELKKLLYEIIAGQAVIYKRLEDLEQRIDGRFRADTEESYIRELKLKAQKIIPHLQKERERS